MRIRKLRKEDFPLLNGLDWSPLPKERDTIYLLLAVEQGGLSWVAEEEDGAFLGVVLATGSPDGRSVYVNHFLVSEPARGRGVGSRLFERFERGAVRRGARRIWLLCRDELLEWYGRRGYRESYRFLGQENERYLRQVKRVHALVKYPSPGRARSGPAQNILP